LSLDFFFFFFCRNKYMQTPTNVYLANLAVSDLLTHVVGECVERC
jgi:hypothetical protein